MPSGGNDCNDNEVSGVIREIAEPERPVAAAAPQVHLAADLGLGGNPGEEDLMHSLDQLLGLREPGHNIAAAAAAIPAQPLAPAAADSRSNASPPQASVTSGPLSSPYLPELVQQSSPPRSSTDHATVDRWHGADELRGAMRHTSAQSRPSSASGADSPRSLRSDAPIASDELSSDEPEPPDSSRSSSSSKSPGVRLESDSALENAYRQYACRRTASRTSPPPYTTRPPPAPYLPRSTDVQAMRYLEARERWREATIRQLTACMDTFRAEAEMHGERLSALEEGMQRNEEMLQRILTAVENRPSSSSDEPPPVEPSPHEQPSAIHTLNGRLSALEDAMQMLTSRVVVLPSAVRMLLRDHSARSDAHSENMDARLAALNDRLDATQDDIRALRTSTEAVAGAMPGLCDQVCIGRSATMSTGNAVRKTARTIANSVEALQQRIVLLEDGVGLQTMFETIRSLKAAVDRSVELQDELQEKIKARGLDAFTERVEQAVSWFEERMDMSEVGSFAARVEAAVGRLEERVERIEKGGAETTEGAIEPAPAAEMRGDDTRDIAKDAGGAVQPGAGNHEAPRKAGEEVEEEKKEQEVEAREEKVTVPGTRERAEEAVSPETKTEAKEEAEDQAPHAPLCLYPPTPGSSVSSSWEEV